MALTPRVRTIVVCDDVSASLTENRVFTLEGVRFEILVPALPCRAPLHVFLVLSSPRKGIFPGKILLVNERDEKLVRYAKFVAEFEHENQLVPHGIDIGDVVFPNSGQYRFEVYFAMRGTEVLKGEHPLTIISDED